MGRSADENFDCLVMERCNVSYWNYDKRTAAGFWPIGQESAKCLYCTEYLRRWSCRCANEATKEYLPSQQALSKFDSFGGNDASSKPKIEKLKVANFTVDTIELENGVEEEQDIDLDSSSDYEEDINFAYPMGGIKTYGQQKYD